MFLQTILPLKLHLRNIVIINKNSEHFSFIQEFKMSYILSPKGKNLINYKDNKNNNTNYVGGIEINQNNKFISFLLYLIS